MEKFSYEANGYNRGEVNNFVKEVIKETEDIINKLNEQDITIENLKKELEAEKNNKRILDEIISIAEKNKDKIKTDEVSEGVDIQQGFEDIAPSNSNAIGEALGALLALGYSSKYCHRH